MTTDLPTMFAALNARDARFDGVFYVGITSTGIYCRPICTARTAKRSNCRFYDSAAAAEEAGFRPCLRCRPELAPGHAPIDDAKRIATLLSHRIDEGMVDSAGGAWMERVAKQFGWSSRQIRRMVQRELGVTPMQLVQTRRLLMAKQLLTDTRLPVSEIAYASGFASLRRFNDAFVTQYRMSPTRFRAGTSPATADGDSVKARLGYRAPFDWRSLLTFLSMRQTRGVELVTDESYERTVDLGGRVGWIVVRNNEEKRFLEVEVARELVPVLPALLGRIRNVFDLGARPDVIDDHLAREIRLSKLVRRNPGLRVPGAFDGFEIALRAILGQQITVKAATTLSGRLVERLGAPVATGRPGLTRLSPTPQALAKVRSSTLVGFGILESRAKAIIALAREASDGMLLEPGGDPDKAGKELTAIPGVGDWTANYIAMRALRSPDAFLPGDVVVRKALGGATPTEAAVLSESWRPFRSYATMHLWKSVN
jgi:AraC family transcriptional regulator of adaptative response / DNA-3-methyladenine glycosylase II